jgi:hypothetical protein
LEYLLYRNFVGDAGILFPARFLCHLLPCLLWSAHDGFSFHATVVYLRLGDLRLVAFRSATSVAFRTALRLRSIRAISAGSVIGTSSNSWSVGPRHCLTRLRLVRFLWHGLASISFDRERDFSFENIAALVLIKPELDRVSAFVRKRTSQASNSRYRFFVLFKSRRRRQRAVVNGFVRSVVDHQDVTGNTPARGLEKTKKSQSRAETNGNA